MKGTIGHVLMDVTIADASKVVLQGVESLFQPEGVVAQVNQTLLFIKLILSQPQLNSNLIQHEKNLK